MIANFDRKTWAIFGYKGKGKSSLAKTIAWKYGPQALYYDTLREVPPDAPFHAYKPYDPQSAGELAQVILALKNMGPRRYKMFIIDEANRFCPPKPRPLPQGIADLNDWCRHPQYSLSVGYVARRPVQINTDLTEICDYLFIFQLGGVNDIRYLNNLRAGLGDTVRSLRPYHFVFVDADRTYRVCSPVSLPTGVAGSDTSPSFASAT